MALRETTGELAGRVAGLAAVLDAAAAGDTERGTALADRYFRDEHWPREAGRLVTEVRSLIEPVAYPAATWHDFVPSSPLWLIGDAQDQPSAHDAGLTAVTRVHRIVWFSHARAGLFDPNRSGHGRQLGANWELLAELFAGNDGGHYRYLAGLIQDESRAAERHALAEFHGAAVACWRRRIAADLPR